MKKFFFRIILFAFLFVCIDHALGKCLSFVSSKAIDGESVRHIEIAYRTTAPIIMMGSSRCEHHYDPRIISKAFGVECYNAGQGGHGIVMMYPFYKMLSSRYNPKLIIYDISLFDVMKEDHSKDLEWLRLFYGNPNVDSVACDISSNERYKMICQSYHYNGKVLTILMDALRHIQPSIYGFRPIDGKIDPNIVYNDPLSPQQAIDPFKKKYFVKLIKDCQSRGTKIVFSISPYYQRTRRSDYYNSVVKLSKQYNIPLLYHLTDTNFIFNPNFFMDRAHLNRQGAEEYTKVITNEIKVIIFNRKHH